MVEHNPDIATLRGCGRESLNRYGDTSKAVYDMTRLASYYGISDTKLQQAVDDLRDEGLLKV